MTQFNAIKRFAQIEGLNFDLVREDAMERVIEVSNDKYVVRCKANTSDFIFLELLTNGDVVTTRTYDTQEDTIRFMKFHAEDNVDFYLNYKANDVLAKLKQRKAEEETVVKTEAKEIETTKETTTDATVEGTLKRDRERVQELRKTKKAITFGLSASSYANMDGTEALEELYNYGCDIAYFETRAGVDTKKEITADVFDQLQAGDMLVVTSLFCIAKTSGHLFKIIADFMDKGITLISLRDAWLDTTGKYDLELIRAFVDSMIKFEQDVLTAHKNNAINKAKHSGTKFGRNLKPNADLDRAVEMYKNNVNNYTVTKIAEMNNISRTTLWRKLRDLRLLEGK